MIRLSIPFLFLARLARRSAARRATVAAVVLAAVGPAAAQGLGPVPVGGEFQVNTPTLGSASGGSVAMDIDGDFVVTWHSGDRNGGSGADLYAQRHDAAGGRQGPEFRINTFTLGRQIGGSVGMDAEGDFVVVWESENQDQINGSGVYAQRYAASGEPVGDEFRVNTGTWGDQSKPRVAVDADGDFVVVWTSDGSSPVPDQPVGVFGVRAQRYTADGAPVGDEFRVDQGEGSYGSYPEVATDADGGFIVTWLQYAVSDNVGGYYAHARRFTSDGTPRGEVFLLNPRLTYAISDVKVVVDAGGGLVAVWSVYDYDARGVYARRFGADGVALGEPFRVSTNQSGLNRSPTVTTDDEGNFVVVWNGSLWGGYGVDENGVYARRYTAAGVPGQEFLVNTYTMGEQRLNSVAMGPTGNFVVSWTSEGNSAPGPDGYSFGVFAQRYTIATVASEPSPSDGLALTVAPNPVGVSGGRVWYETPEPGLVRVVVTDVLGREVAVLVDGERMAGAHEAAFDTGRLAPGVYVVRLTAGAATAVHRVTVAR